MASTVSLPKAEGALTVPPVLISLAKESVLRSGVAGADGIANPVVGLVGIAISVSLVKTATVPGEIETRRTH